MPADHALTPLEIASGMVFGSVEAPEAPGDGSPPESPLAALERECRAALRHPPCLVSFSGGVDSSLVLAVATHAARREGLPLPVPATNRFPLAGETDESEWQERVVEHLGLPDWVRLDLTDELDAVGPYATAALRRHGLLWPFNAHFHSPLLEAARGGSLLTGIGGDELFGVPRWGRALDVLGGRARPTPRDIQRVALLASPRPLRRAVIARRMPVDFEWLRPEAQRELARLWAADSAGEAARLATRVRQLQAGRVLRVGLRSLELLARDAGGRIGHPLASPRVGAAVAAAAPWRGFDSRSEAVSALFGGVLPPELLTRTTKACFDEAFWGRHSRALAASWDGAGADPSVVDHARLRATWSSAVPDSHTYLLAQSAWLARNGGSMKNGGPSHTASGDHWNSDLLWTPDSQPTPGDQLAEPHPH